MHKQGGDRNATKVLIVLYTTGFEIVWQKVRKRAFSNRQAASLSCYFKLDMLGFRCSREAKCQESIQNFECIQILL